MFGDRGQLTVAAHAAGEGRQPLSQVESFDHLKRLFLGLLRVDEQPVGDGAALQQAPVAGQQDPLLAQADFGQRRVVGVARPPHVEAEHAKQPGEPAEVDVHNEAGIAQRHRAQPGGRPDVQGLEHRVGGDPVTGARAVAEPPRRPVHQDEVDLGVRNAHRLEHVLDRLVAAERPAHRHTA